MNKGTVTLATVLLGCSGLGQAGEPAADQPAAELPKIVVVDTTDAEYAEPNASSGTKTDTPLLVTPVVVTVIPQQVLKDQQVASLQEALANSSGVWSYSQGQGCDGTCEAINMRGFTQFGGVLTDGFLSGSAGGLTNLSNVERIEVVKGPASILYGRMEPGGAVNLVTKKPQAVASSYVDQALGSRSTYVTTFDATGPVNESKSVLFRINGTWNRHGLYVSGFDNDRRFVAASLQWNITAKTHALVEATYDKNQYNWLREIYPTDPATGHPAIIFPYSDKIYPNEQFATTRNAKLTLSHDFNDSWNATFQFSGARSDQHSGPGSYSIGWFDQVGDTWRVWRTLNASLGDNQTQGMELDFTGHFSTGSAKHTLLLGADSSRQRTFATAGNSIDAAAFDYFYDITDVLHPVLPVGGMEVNAWWGTRNRDTRDGVYVQDQVALPGNVHVLAGLRHSRVTFDSRDELSGEWVSGFGVAPMKTRATRKDSAVTPRVGVLWEVRPGTSLYASYTENFGRFQPTFDWQNNALDPQLAKQEEIGLKQQSADGKLSASLALYEIRKTNEAIIDPAHTGCLDGITGLAGGPGSPCYRAAGLTRGRGVELDLIGELRRGWNVLANYSYNDTRILDNGGEGGEGQRVGYYPAHMARLSTTYRLPAGILQGLKIGAGMTYTGATDLGNSSPIQTISPAYTLFDAMVSRDFTLGASRIELQLNVKNLTDKSYVITATEGGFFSILPHGDPRTVMARVRVNF